MSFLSILFRDESDSQRAAHAAMPECFADLNLDQIVAATTAGREEYNLKPFFYCLLGDLDGIAFRHEVFQDLAHPEAFAVVQDFAKAMRTVREHLQLSEKLRHPLQKQRWFLDAALIYCAAVCRLASGFAGARLKSRGLLALHKYLNDYIAGDGFGSLRRAAEELAGRLTAIEYSVMIHDGRVEVRRYDGEPDYSANVLATFERFRQGAASGYKFDFAEPPDLNHIEQQILDRVALLNRDMFVKLAEFYTAIRDFFDPVLLAFDRESQFYAAYIEHTVKFAQTSLKFCYPRVSEIRDQAYSDQGFDLALANALLAEGTTPVCNDFRLGSRERIIVVSGPNQGGKTTFARTFGQLHYLASLGCPVPGQRAQLYLFDTLFTHFERSERMVSLHGKLQDDLLRIHRILAAATPRSIVILNEIFTSTTLRDALLLSRRIADALIRLDLYCVWVSFIDELSTLAPQTVSMVSTVNPDNPSERTFKIVRRPADGLAYATSIAEKYRLTFDMIRRRLAR